MSTWTILGANFDQMHMNHNVRWAAEHPDATLAGLCDEHPEASTGSMETAADDLGVPDDRRFSDLEESLEALEPDIVMTGPANVNHADYVERLAPYGVHVIVEKPMADTLANADRMIDAMADSAGRLAINWPSTWGATTRSIERAIDEGRIGDVAEVEYSTGHGGPPRDSWFYDADAGGGSLLDFVGYGVVNTTWFRGGDLPESVTAEAYVPEGHDVDTRSTVIATYDGRPSVYQSTWARHPELGDDPDPKSGYVVVGTEGTISTRIPESGYRLRNGANPDGTIVDPEPVEKPYQNAVQYVIDRLESDRAFEGPTGPPMSRKAQQIMETARVSIEEGRRVPLIS
jgi:glucose-fructose oxidoreductase